MPNSSEGSHRRFPRIITPQFIRTLGVALPLSFLLLCSFVAALPRHRARPATLSETGLYSEISTKTIAPSNLMYSPQYPLWSDGAKKKRWIYIPPGHTIDAKHPDDWVFPVGTKLWKEFSFGKRVETRFLEKVDGGTWEYATYAWKEDGTDAVLVPQEGFPNHVEIAPGVRHDIPGIDGCRACHEGQGRDVVLGFNALQLSPDRDPNAPHAEPFTPDMINLKALAEKNLLTHFPARLLSRPPVIEAGSPLERAALGYLSGNCGGCHNTTDPLSSVGMFLKRSVDRSPKAMAKELESVIGHRSKYQIPGLGAGDSYRIYAGHSEQSSVVFRMSSRNPYRQMPPLGTKIVDTLAVDLITRWIEEERTTIYETAHFIHH
jgi:hypothetical protein